MKLFYKNQSIKKLHKGALLTQPSNAYLIELDRFNITPGFRTRENNNVEYTLEDYAVAKSNVQGIQNALEYAKQEGYDTVILPQGEYSTCYFPNYCIQVNDINFYGSGSTLKVMFDSTHFNPYDTKLRRCHNADCANYDKQILFNDDGTCPLCGRNYVYDFRWGNLGKAFVISFTENSRNKTIRDFHLIGDLPERTWTDFDKKSNKFYCENGTEDTYGVNLNGVNCTLQNIEVEGFMGDGLTSSNAVCFGYNKYAFPIINDQPNGQSYMGKLYYTLGGLDDNGNEIDNTEEQITNNDKMLRTAMLTINKASYDKDEVPYVMCLRSSERFPSSLTDLHFYLYFYDEEQRLIRIQDEEIYNNFEFPSNAKYIRGLLKHQKLNVLSSLTLTFETTHDCKTINCSVHDNHRGGITGAGENYVFNNITMFNNGLSTNGSPIFPDTTRYQFNQEESYSYKTILKNCQINQGFNGILLGVYYSVIDGCTFNNQSYSNIVLYGIKHCEIKNNVFNNMGRVTFIDDKERDIPKEVLVHDNIFNKTGASFGMKHNVIIENNIFNDGVDVSGNIIRYNTFKGIENTNSSNMTCLKYYENNFENISKSIFFKRIDNEIVNVENCTFSSCDAIGFGGDISFTNCEFISSLFQTYNYSNGYLSCDNCTFTNSEIELARFINVSDWSNIRGYTLKDVTFTNCTFSCYYNSYNDAPVEFILDNCTLNGSLTTINKQAHVNGKFTIVLNNCTVNLDSIDSLHYIVLNNCNLVKPLPDATNVTIK